MPYIGTLPQTVTSIQDDLIINADINSSAAIAKSKLASLGIVNADVDNSAAIAKSKLASLGIVNADVDASAAIAQSKLVDIVNADVDASAAIAQSKLVDIVNADVDNSAAIATSKLSGAVTSIASHGLATSATTDTTNASNLASGTVPTARLGSGTANSSSFLRGDGTWNAAGGGKILQSLGAQISATNGTTGIPDDNTVPTSSEGTQIYSQALTCASTSNKVLISFALNTYINVGSGVVITIFAGSTCIHANSFGTPTGANWMIQAASCLHAPSSTSAITYSVRVGQKTATGTWRIGELATARYGGALAGNSIIIQEIDYT